MSIELPEAVAGFFAISNRGDVSRLPGCFAADALVKDENQEHRGLPAIRDWLLAAQAKYDYRATPESFSHDGATLAVIARVEGNFPGSPVRLTHAFVMADEKIVSLEIGA